MTTPTLFHTILAVEIPLSQSETKPIRDLSEDDCYTARKHLEASGQRALADALAALECEIGLSGENTAGDLPIATVIEFVGNAPVPR